MTTPTTDNLQAQIAALEAALPRLDASSRTFASSMIQQWRRRGSLSVRQWPHVSALTERANRQTTTTTGTAPMRGAAVETTGVNILINHLETAQGRGSRPAVTVPVGGSRYRLALPQNRSRYAGRDVLFVRRDGGYIGRVEEGRFFSSSMDPTPDEARTVRDLAPLLADPIGLMAAVGQRTGVCCFCARQLTDGRSVSMGYGPICAEHFGLPWGEQSPSVPVLGARAALVERAAVARVTTTRAVVGAAQNSTVVPPDQMDDEDRQFLGSAPR